MRRVVSMVCLLSFTLSNLAVALGQQQRERSAPPPRSEPDIGRPLAWLLAAQNEDGGWGEGTRTNADVATTAISALALLRLGHTWSAGEHRASTRKAVEFVVRAIEKTPAEDVDVNPPGTLPQRKLGRHIDTFLSAELLGEVLPSVPAGREHERIEHALGAVVSKTYRVQRADGGYAQDGWAPVLSSAFANSGLYAAKRAGERVRADVLAKGDQYMLNNFDEKAEQFRTKDSAGVGLYAVAGTAQSAARTGQMGGAAGQAAIARLSDEGFLRGFGSYGGEEHVSYMLTSEALAEVGGTHFTKWQKAITQRLASIQRADGTWRGDHCITSTSFCTAASLITLAVHVKGSKNASRS